MKKLLLLITALFLLVSVDGQILRYSNYTAPTPPEEPASNAPSFLTSDGDTELWLIASEESTITKDGSNLVNEWRDYLGSARKVVNTDENSMYYPLWTAGGVSFDGSVQYLTGAFTLTQPETVYIVFTLETYATWRYIFDGITGDVGALLTETTNNVWNAYAGTVSSGKTLSLNTAYVAAITFNGASSVYQINDDTPITGNFGSSNMGGLTLGRTMGSAGTNADVVIKEVIVRSASDSETNRNAVVTYLINEYSIPL